MEISFTALILSFLGTVPLGFVFGALYDVVRIVRILTGVTERGDRSLFSKIYSLGIKDHFKGRKEGFLKALLTSLGDVIYFTVVSVLFILYLYRYNDGIFRWFYLAGCVPGFLLYRVSLGRVVMGISRAAADTAALVLNILIFAIFLPFRLLFRCLKVLTDKFLFPAAKKITLAIDTKKNKYYTIKCKGMINDLVDILGTDGKSI